MRTFALFLLLAFGAFAHAQDPNVKPLPERKDVVSWKTLEKVQLVKQKDRYVPQFDAGIAAGHLLVAALGAWLEANKHHPVSGAMFRPEELWVVGIAVAVGLAAALLPAYRAYRTDVSRTLSEA